MEQELKGKVIVVTGGFGNLGTATAIKLMSHGARVAVLDSQEPSSKAQKTLEGAFVLGGVDLSSYSVARSAMSEVFAHYGEIFGVVNVAGSFRWAKVEGDDI